MGLRSLLPLVSTSRVLNPTKPACFTLHQNKWGRNRRFETEQAWHRSAGRYFTGRVLASAKESVTRVNFWERLPEVRAAIEAADFVAIDFEFSGLEAARWRRGCLADTLETRYLHMKHSAENFAVLQAGICPFKWEPLKERYEAKPYNFYLFPRKLQSLNAFPEHPFLSQTASIEFLARHKFDFNACINEGIGYLSLEQEIEARRRLNLDTPPLDAGSPKKQALEKAIELSHPADVLFVTRLKVQLKKWHDRCQRVQQDKAEAKAALLGSTSGAKKASAHEDRNDVERADKLARPSNGDRRQKAGRGRVMRADLLTGMQKWEMVAMDFYHRRLVAQAVRETFPDVAVLHQGKAVQLSPGPGANHPEDDSVHLVLAYAGSAEAKETLERAFDQAAAQELAEEVAEAVGFRNVMEAIWAAKKPVVGHNCMLDLLHCYTKFVGPLPASVSDFCSALLAYLPCVIDTKYLMRSSLVARQTMATRGSGLGRLYKKMVALPSHPGKAYERVPVVMAPGYDRYKDAAALVASDLASYHEAGFDAFMTGAVFAQAAKIMGLSPPQLRQRLQMLANPGPLAALKLAPGPVHPDASSISSAPKVHWRKRQQFQSVAHFANAVMMGRALDLLTGEEATAERKVLPRIGSARTGKPEEEQLSSTGEAVLVWHLEKEPSPKELVRLAGKVVGRRAGITAHVLDEGAALLSFPIKEEAKRFLSAVKWALHTQGRTDMRRTGGQDIDMEAFSGMKVAPYSTYLELCKSGAAGSSLSEVLSWTERSEASGKAATSLAASVDCSDELTPDGDRSVSKLVTGDKVACQGVEDGLDFRTASNSLEIQAPKVAMSD